VQDQPYWSRALVSEFGIFASLLCGFIPICVYSSVGNVWQWTKVHTAFLLCSHPLSTTQCSDV